MHSFRKRILIIYSGGTFGMVHAGGERGLRPGNIEDFHQHLPQINQLPCEIEYLSLPEPIDSSNVNPEDWVALARTINEHYDHYDGFVILHGTDTMAFTASALSFMLENLGKPVIFTGSMLPIDLIRSDGRENFVNALEIASHAEQRLCEVSICFDAKLYRGNRAIKFSSEKFHAYLSPNYPTLAEAGFQLEYYYPNWLTPPAGDFRLQPKLDPNVGLVKFHPGLSRAFLEPILLGGHFRAMVVESYGNGNLPTIPWLLELLEEAVRRGMMIVNVSQCTAGRVALGKYETSRRLKEIGITSGADLTTAAALTKLMYLFGKYEDNPAYIRDLFYRNLSGEMGAREEHGEPSTFGPPFLRASS